MQYSKRTITQCHSISELQTQHLQPRHLCPMQCHELKNVPCYMFVKTVLHVQETRHCHMEVPPPKMVPRVLWQVIAEIGSTYLNTLASAEIVKKT